MNIVVFITGSSRQLIDWARCKGHWRHKEIDRMAGETFHQYNSPAIISISLCLRWPSHRAQPISYLDDRIKTMTFILAFYSSDDSWKVLDGYLSYVAPKTSSILYIGRYSKGKISADKIGGQIYRSVSMLTTAKKSIKFVG